MTLDPPRTLNIKLVQTFPVGICFIYIHLVQVDMPPSYTEVTPGSPAPSYKSDMAVPVPTIPGSPAPSYKSVDIPVVKTEGGMILKIQVLDPPNPLR